MKKILAVVLALTLALAMFTGCGNNTQGNDSSAAVQDNSLQAVLDKGELVIGLDDTFAPMGFHDESGELVGFDIDLAKAVCEKLGVTATFQPIDWDAKDMELNTGKIDCIWNGMSSTPERQESMSLSNAYLNNRIIVMTKEGVTIADKADLVNYNIGIQAKSAALEVVQADEIYSSISDKIVEYKTYDEVIMDMQAGRLDCMIVDEVLGQYKNSKLDNAFGVADFDFGDDLYVIGLRKNDVALTDAINNAMAQVIEEGTAETISNKWFGTNIVLS